jgi:uncharacterized membrane protein
MDIFKNPLNLIRKNNEEVTPDSLARGFRARLEADTKWTDKVADVLTDAFGTVAFLILNALFFLGWILLNDGVLGNEAFDPFPYGLLTMVVSLEAIFLATIVLITQNRQGKIADMRQKMDFEIDVRAESEISKILELLAELHKHEGLAKKDAELDEMIKKTDLDKLEADIRNGRS